MATKSWLTTEEAAARLGVKTETLYAYVSRGIVNRRLAPSGKGSEFSRKEIEDLANRSARTPRRGAVDVTIATRVSSIDGEQLFYRGVALPEILANCSFEQTADHLWDDQGMWDHRAGKRVPGLAQCLRRVDRIRLAVAFHGATSPVRITSSPAAVCAITRSLIVATAHAVGDGPPKSVSSILAGQRPRRGLVQLLDRVLVAIADHEMATSTLAARVAASTRAGVHDVIFAGLGAVGGPLHGSASEPVHVMFERAHAEGIDHVIDTMLRSGQRLPGIGHKVYRTEDPRYPLLLESLLEITTADQRRLILGLRDAMIERVPRAVNVDFVLGAMSYCLGTTSDLGEVLFSIARMSGWIAHALEEYEEQPLRFRGRALYVG